MAVSTLPSFTPLLYFSEYHFFFLCSEVCKLLYYTYSKVSARVCYIALALKLLIHVLFFSL